MALLVDVSFCDLAGGSGQVILLPRFSQGPCALGWFVIYSLPDTAPCQGAGQLPMLLLFPIQASTEARGKPPRMPGEFRKE